MEHNNIEGEIRLKSDSSFNNIEGEIRLKSDSSFFEEIRIDNY